MAHECPDCGSLCYCNGDVDDRLLNDEEDVIACTHYKKCEADSNDCDMEYTEDE